MTSWQIYWLTRMDSINCFLQILFFGPLIFLVLWYLAHAITTGEMLDFKLARPIIFYLLIIGSVLTFFPNTKETAAIILIPKITNAISQNEKLKQLPDNVLDLANDWIKELKPKEESK